VTRYRRTLAESQTGGRNRWLKLLKRANIKLASGATDGLEFPLADAESFRRRAGELGGDGRTGHSRVRNRIPNEFQVRPVLRALNRFPGLDVIK
jgi:hypothetical protein